jgi:prepilin-type N-terminal cleavage/methylation domain-containing protein
MTRARWFPTSQPAGMTLIEVLVGLTITGVVMGVAYAAFASILDHRERAAEAHREIARAAAVRAALADWISGARLTAEEDGTEMRGLDGEYQGNGDAELSFLTTAVTPLEGGQTLVRLFIDRDESTLERGLTAELAEWRGTSSKRIEVEPLATGLSLRYLSSVSGDVVWYPSWVSSSVLPLAVELTLSADADHNGGDGLAPLIRLPILVPLRAGR